MSIQETYQNFIDIIFNAYKSMSQNGLMFREWILESHRSEFDSHMYHLIDK